MLTRLGQKLWEGWADSIRAVLAVESACYAPPAVCDGHVDFRMQARDVCSPSLHSLTVSFQDTLWEPQQYKRKHPFKILLTDFKHHVFPEQIWPSVYFGQVRKSVNNSGVWVDTMENSEGHFGQNVIFITGMMSKNVPCIRFGTYTNESCHRYVCLCMDVMIIPGQEYILYQCQLCPKHTHVQI